MPSYFSKYWPTIRDYTLFLISCVLLISPFVTYFIFGLFNEITSYELKSHTFFSLLLMWFIPGVILGICLLPFGIMELSRRKKSVWIPRLWIAIVLISVLACSALLASYGIEGYCGERLQQSCGNWH